MQHDPPDHTDEDIHDRADGDAGCDQGGQRVRRTERLC
jgi:hypothetical protein